MRLSPGTVQSSCSPTQLVEEPNAPFFLPPSSDEAGLSVISVLNYGLHFPLRSASSKSGFDYFEELLSYGIKKEDWQEFASTITLETKSSLQQLIAVVGEGLGRLAVGGVIVGISSAVPLFFAAPRARIRQEMLESVTSSANCRIHFLARHVSYWNDSFFRSRGVIIRLDLFDGHWDDHERIAFPKPSSTWQTCKVKMAANRVARIVVVLPKL